MTEIVNNVLTQFEFVNKGTGIDVIGKQLNDLKINLKSMSAPEIFDMSDGINKNIASLREQIKTQQEMASSMLKSGEGVNTPNLKGLEKAIKIPTENLKIEGVEDSKKSIQDLNTQLDFSKKQLSLVTAELNKFGGTKDNFTFLDNASKSLGKNFSQVQVAAKQLNLVGIENGQVLNKITGATMSASKATADLQKNMKGFRGDLLSVMFLLMGLQNILMGFLRSAITTFQTANDESTQMGKATWELQAAWEFLKYSLIDALTQSPLFQMMIGWILELVNWFNELSTKTKGIIALALVFIIVAVAIGLVALQLEIAAEASGGFAALGANFAIAFIGVLVIMLILAGLIIVIYMVIDIIKNGWGKTWEEVAQKIITILLGLAMIVGGIALLMGAWLVAGIALALALILAAVLWVIDGFKKSWTEGFNNLLIVIGVFATICIILFASIWIAATAPLWLVIAFWIMAVALIVAIVVAVVLVIIKYWYEISSFFWISMKIVVDAILWFYNIEAYVVDLIAKGFVYLWYGIQMGAQMATKFIVESLMKVAEGIISLMDKVPGLGAITSALRSGIDSVKQGIDSWGTSIEDTKNAAINLIDTNGAQAGVAALKKVTDDAFNNKLAQIESDKQASLKAIADKAAAEKAASDKAIADKKAATDAANKETAKNPNPLDALGIPGISSSNTLADNVGTNNALTSGAVGGSLGTGGVSKLLDLIGGNSNSQNTTIVKNDNSNTTVNMTATGGDTQEVTKNVMTQLSDLLNRKTDTANY